MPNSGKELDLPRSRVFDAYHKYMPGERETNPAPANSVSEFLRHKQ
jgi:hypothetical protein